MKSHSLFSIKDKKAGYFLPPFVARNNDDAQRMMVQLLQKGESQFTKFPDDYDLYFLGAWYEDTGTIVNDEPPKVIVNFRSLAIITNPNPEANNV